MSYIAIIDYGMGNLQSVSKAVESIAASRTIRITSDPEAIHAAERVIFPGVGAIRDCIDELQRLELVEAIREAALTRPTLGICLGMQALFNRSDENGGIDALGLIAGEVHRFPSPLLDSRTGTRLKIPHMGWNQVHQTRSHPLWAGIADHTPFYFVHSFYAAPRATATVFGESEHGLIFPACVGQGCLFATQFHPEKSQNAGLQLLVNFLQWDGAV